MSAPSSAVRRGPVALLRVLAADQRIRYLAAGGFSAGVFYLVFLVAWLALEGTVPYVPLSMLANMITALIIYPIYRTVVFRHDGAYWRGFAKFYSVYAWGLVIALVGLPLLVEVAGLPVLVAQALIIVLTPLVSYQVHKLWTFARRTNRPPTAS